MPDTPRLYSALAALFADNTGEEISAQDLRDFLASVVGARTVVTKTADYTLQAGDEIILVDATAAAVTITLTAAASSLHRSVQVIKTDASGNAVTIDGAAAETINGAATLALATQYAGARLHCNGTTWFVGGRGVSAGSGITITAGGVIAAEVTQAELDAEASARAAADSAEAATRAAADSAEAATRAAADTAEAAARAAADSSEATTRATADTNEAIARAAADTALSGRVTTLETDNPSSGSPLSLARGGTGASLSSPGADRMWFWDQSANGGAGAFAALTPGTNLSISGTTLNAVGGTLEVPVNDFRLSLTAGSYFGGEPGTVSTVRLVPKGEGVTTGRMAVYDGTDLQIVTSAEISLNISALSDGAYDIFAYSNAGTLTLEAGAIWTTVNSRSSEPVWVKGMRVKAGATTRRLVGSIYVSGGAVTDNIVTRNLANECNRVWRRTFICPGYNDNNATTTYNKAAGNFSELNGSCKLSYMVCDSGHVVAIANLVGTVQNGANASAQTFLGIGIDSSTSAFATDFTQAGSNVQEALAIAAAVAPSTPGAHYFTGLVSASTVTSGVYADVARLGSTADPYVTYLEAYVWQ